VFSDVFQSSYQLIDVEPRQHTYLACALLMRGNVVTGELRGPLRRPPAQPCSRTLSCSLAAARAAGDVSASKGFMARAAGLHAPMGIKAQQSLCQKSPE
jgi:hypothetical protein